MEVHVGRRLEFVRLNIKFWTLKQSYIEMTKDTSIKIAEISIQKELDIFFDDANHILQLYAETSIIN